MKATVSYSAGNGVVVQVEAENVKESVKAMATYMEVFGEQACGCCASKAIHWEHRRVNDNDYYSIRCGQCNAELSLGQTKTGNRLFAKRKEHPDTNGWQQVAEKRLRRHLRCCA